MVSAVMTVGAATNNFKDIIITIEVDLLLLRLLNSVVCLFFEESVVEKLPLNGIWMMRYFVTETALALDAV